MVPFAFAWPQDIQAKIIADFGMEMFSRVSEQLGVLYSQGEGFRLIRCVLQLAQGSMDNLRHFVEQARLDSRDVIYWAEYDAHGRIRDYNEPFPAHDL